MSTDLNRVHTSCECQVRCKFWCHKFATNNSHELLQNIHSHTANRAVTLNSLCEAFPLKSELGFTEARNHYMKYNIYNTMSAQEKLSGTFCKLQILFLVFEVPGISSFRGHSQFHYVKGTYFFQCSTYTMEWSPMNIKTSPNVNIFKKRLKAHLYSKSIFYVCQSAFEHIYGYRRYINYFDWLIDWLIGCQGHNQDQRGDNL